MIRKKNHNLTPGRNMPGKLAMTPKVKKSSEVRGVLDSRKLHISSRSRLDEIPETSPEIISECVAKVEIALKLGNEEQAVSAIRYAFANGLCVSEPHDPRELADDEPLAATILGGGPGVLGEQHIYIRLLDTLERYGFTTVGQVRSVGYAGIMRIPFVSNRLADVIAEAVGLNLVSKKAPPASRTALSH